MDLGTEDDGGGRNLHESGYSVDQMSKGEIVEPCVGMEFESEDDAKIFYVEYARKLGFVVRLMQRRRSGIDGRTLARRLGCNRQGYSPNSQRSADFAAEKRQRHSAREGCKATILVKLEKSGKWVITRFVKEHNHPLIITASPYNSLADKDKQIEELTKELERQDRLCASYRERLLGFMDNVEKQTEEMSIKIHEIVENVKKLESQMQRHNNSSI